MGVNLLTLSYSIYRSFMDLDLIHCAKTIKGNLIVEYFKRRIIAVKNIQTPKYTSRKNHFPQLKERSGMS